MFWGEDGGVWGGEEDDPTRGVLNAGARVGLVPHLGTRMRRTRSKS